MNFHSGIETDTTAQGSDSNPNILDYASKGATKSLLREQSQLSHYHLRTRKNKRPKILAKTTQKRFPSRKISGNAKKSLENASSMEPLNENSLS